MTSVISPRLELRGLTKDYSGITVLDNVDLAAGTGEAHALLGENGAGKSTLLKILSGVVRPTSGAVSVDGVSVEGWSMNASRSAGIAMIHQELQQIPEMTVTQNMFLGHPMLRGGVTLDKHSMARRAEEVLSTLDPTIDPTAPVKNLRVARRQVVEIARALLFKAKIIAMDEPTSSLMPSEVQRLEEVIRNLQERGVTILYVSHKLDEVLRICSRGTVLRDGRLIADIDLAGKTEADLVSLMVGRDLVMQNHQSSAQEEVVLEAENLCWSGKVTNASFTLRKGEVLGISGLVGAGRTELMHLLSGLQKPSSGKVFVRGREMRLGSVRTAIRNGIGLVPEERKLEGIVPLRSALSNAALTSLPGFSRQGWIRSRTLRDKVKGLFRELRLRPMDPDKMIRLFSGGNQQKVIIARWLLAESQILLLDEPTRGIDVGAKQEIYRVIQRLAAEGKSTIVVSSELFEIVSLSDRVLVMRESRITAELERHELSEETIMQYAAREVAPLRSAIQ